MECRVLESKRCVITQGANNTNHIALDLVKEGYMLDYIVAHSDGKVIFHQDGYSNMKNSSGNATYGNCVKIDHGNGYQTLYAHMQKGLSVKFGQIVKKGQRLGYMSDSGRAYGAHLHWEVWKNGSRINPTEYLNKDFESNTPSSSQYKVGDVVTINGVYTSSTSTEKLTPAITKGTITRIVEYAKNPYLLDNGNIGWVNNDCIVSNTSNIKYLHNPNYQGTSIVDALNQIGVDGSFSNRSKLAQINGITDYRGTAEQNTKMLEMLKNGTLKSV